MKNLTQINPEMASDLLKNGKKVFIKHLKDKRVNGRSVEWINLNNRTLFAVSEKQNSGSTYYLENVSLFCQS